AQFWGAASDAMSAWGQSLWDTLAADGKTISDWILTPQDSGTSDPWQSGDTVNPWDPTITGPGQPDPLIDSTGLVTPLDPDKPDQQTDPFGGSDKTDSALSGISSQIGFGQSDGGFGNDSSGWHDPGGFNSGGSDASTSSGDPTSPGGGDPVVLDL